MSKYDVGDVIVLLPNLFPTRQYWGQPLEIIEDYGHVYYCTCPENGRWIVALEEVKGYFANEEM